MMTHSETLKLSYSNEKWSWLCPQNAPLPDCGGIGTAFVEQHINENNKQRDVTNLPYGYPLIVAVIRQAINDYETALFDWLTNHKSLGELGEPYAFLSDFADSLGVSIDWMEEIMRKEVYEKIKRKERINGRKRNCLW